MNNEVEIAYHESAIERLEGENRSLEDRYQGVRPSWVSGDIGYNDMLIRNHKAQIEELKNG